jgi:hypothetical protein
VQHRARLRIIHPQLARPDPATSLGCWPSADRKVARAVTPKPLEALELAVQLAGLLVPHLEAPLVAPDKQSKPSRGAPPPWLTIVITTHPVTSLVLPLVGSSYTARQRQGVPQALACMVWRTCKSSPSQMHKCLHQARGDPGAAVRGPLVGDEAEKMSERAGGLAELPGRRRCRCPTRPRRHRPPTLATRRGAPPSDGVYERTTANVVIGEGLPTCRPVGGRPPPPPPRQPRASGPLCDGT